MPSQVLTFTWAQGSETITIAETFTADTILPSGDYPIAAGGTNVEIDIPIDKDFAAGTSQAPSGVGLVLLFLVADGVLTIKTNSTSSPGDTITTVANKPIVLRNGGAWPATSFAADVTKLYVTNATGGTLNLRLRGLTRLLP